MSVITPGSGGLLVADLPPGSSQLGETCPQFGSSPGGGYWVRPGLRAEAARAERTNNITSQELLGWKFWNSNLSTKNQVGFVTLSCGSFSQTQK